MRVTLDIPGTAAELAELLGRPALVSDPADPRVRVPNPTTPAAYVREHVGALVAGRLKSRAVRAAQRTAEAATAAPAVVVS